MDDLSLLFLANLVNLLDADALTVKFELIIVRGVCFMCT